VQHTTSPENLSALGKQSADQAQRDGVAARFAAPAVPQRMAVDLARIPSDDVRLRAGARRIRKTARHQDANTRSRRPTVPGIGQMLRRGRLDAVHAIRRVPRGQDVLASCRLGKCRTAAGAHAWGPPGRRAATPIFHGLCPQPPGAA
jgi:hypothetical protein